MYDNFRYVPIVGLTGCGKTELIETLKEGGKQVLSVEEIAGIRGVCLKNMTDAFPIDQKTFAGQLADAFSTYSVQKPIYVEWKPPIVLGFDLPEALVKAVRSSVCFAISESKEERVERLMNYYAEWENHLDLLAENLTHRMRKEDVALLFHYASLGDFRRYVETCLSRYFDPLYVDEICLFDGFFCGEFELGRHPMARGSLPKPSYEHVAVGLGM